MGEGETLLLLPVNSEFQQRISENRTKIVGGLLAVLCSLGFSGSNFFVKTHHLDFIDFLLIRSFIQFLVFGIVSKFKNGGKFYPKRSEHETLRSYLMEVSLLIIQV